MRGIRFLFRNRLLTHNPVSGLLAISPDIASHRHCLVKIIEGKLTYVKKCGHLSTDKFGRCEDCGDMLSTWGPEDIETVIKEEAVERETKKWVVLLENKPDSPKLVN